jgi:poly(A) polymerase
VNGPTSDIDALCVAPQHIDRTKHFFGLLAPRLKDTPGITGLTEVREAFVPVIKMEFDGVEIDLLFTRVQRKTVTDDLGDLLDDNILRGCDALSIRSLAGSRDTNKILQLVPNKANFELVLRCIKLWAKNRGIYSNVMGYFGGITWALLVAKICIDNRDAAPNKLLARFFEFYRDYPWSSQYPISIT